MIKPTSSQKAFGEFLLGVSLHAQVFEIAGWMFFSWRNFNISYQTIPLISSFYKILLFGSTIPFHHLQFTCITKAISMTKLVRYPRTRLTTPLATVEDPTSIPTWNQNTFQILHFTTWKLVGPPKPPPTPRPRVCNLPPSSSSRENNVIEVLDPLSMLSYQRFAWQSMIPEMWSPRDILLYSMDSTNLILVFRICY